MLVTLLERLMVRLIDFRKTEAQVASLRNEKRKHHKGPYRHILKVFNNIC